MSVTVDKIARAIKKLEGNSQFVVRSTENEENTTWDSVTIEFVNGSQEFTQSQIQAEIDRLQIEYDALDYARKRSAEYPSVQDLVVALYDTDDKAAIDEKRAAVKLKYLKP